MADSTWKAAADADAAGDYAGDVIVVGGMRAGGLADDRIGGQLFACRSLVESPLHTTFRLHCIDTSTASIKTRANSLTRLPVAIGRVARLVSLLVRLKRPRCIFFSGNGFSFAEKGLMTLCARALGSRVLLLPRSGHLTEQVERSRLFRWYVRLVLRRASVVVCQSESWRSYFHGIAGGRGRFEVLENWLADTAFVAPDAPAARSGGPGFVVGYFNRIEHAKGIFEFLEAVRLASARVRNLRARIYGDGNAVEPMVEWIRERGLTDTIEYCGWLGPADKAATLRRLDAYLFSSSVEGFPNSLLEVVALKVPVISVRVGAVPDVLEDAHSALLAPIGDAAALADAIVRLAGTPLLGERLAENAYARVQGCNTLERAVAFFEKHLR